MKKHTFLLMGLTTGLIPAQTLATICEKQEGAWKPGWFRESKVISDSKNFTGNKNSHWNWDKSVYFADLKLPFNYKSYDIINFEFNYRISYVEGFKTHYDGRSIALNNDELGNVQKIFNAKQSIDLWVEGDNKFIFGGLVVKFGISNDALKSAYDNTNFTSFATWYNVDDFHIKIEYQYLLNTPEEEQAEEAIRNYFLYERDYLKVFTYHNGKEILEMVTTGLKKLLPFKAKKDLKVDLYNKDYQVTGKTQWNIHVSLFNGVVRTKNGANFFTLKLKNIKKASNEVEEIYKILRDNDWEISSDSQHSNFDSEARKEYASEIFASSLAKYASSTLKQTITNTINNEFFLQPLNYNMNYKLQMIVALKKHKVNLFDRPVTIVDFDEE